MRKLIAVLGIALAALGCEPQQGSSPSAPVAGAPRAAARPATPPLDPNNIVSIASGSKDHRTLVAALKAADYVTSVANPGPLTVFAPTDAAFDKLPAGTLDTLLKPEKVDELRNVLKYHVAAAVYEPEALKDGMLLGMANGAKTSIRVEGGRITVNGANVLASIRASNGIVHVVDGVLLPPAK